MQSRAKLDPAPRSYPPAVTLVRRAQRHGESIPNLTTAAAIEEWLLSSAIRENDLLGLFHSFVLRLVTAGLPLERVSLHVGTLHPQLIGFGWVWGQSDGLCDEFQVAEAALRSHAYRLNPLYRVIEYGEKVRSRPPIPLPSASRWIAWITAPRRRMLR